MGAVFAGIVRAPMTSVLIVFEMTGGYGLVLPLMIANMSAFALARMWRRTPFMRPCWLRTVFIYTRLSGRWTCKRTCRWRNTGRLKMRLPEEMQRQRKSPSALTAGGLFRYR